MSSSALAYETRKAHGLSRFLDYVELTKPRIVVLELAAVAVVAYVATAGSVTSGVVLHAVLGTALVAAGASACNQILERHHDLRMERTARRPLPAGRLSPREVLVFAAVCSLLGVGYLAATVNLSAAAWGLANWVVYVCFYTPLKTRSAWNTAMGAVAGAMPVLIGWSVAGARLNLAAWALFATVFLWQFPHFMAIAWLYKQDYLAAGLKMLTVVDPTGRRAGRLAVATAALLLPVSALPALLGAAGTAYLAGACLLGISQLACAVSFAARRDDHAARRLFRASLVYLPTILALLMLGPAVF